MEEILKLLVPAFFAIIGVVIGGFATYKGNMRIKQVELNHQIKREELAAETKLYAEFLSSVNVATLKSVESKDNFAAKLEKTLGLLAQIELSSSKEVHSKAVKISEELTHMYVANSDKNTNGLKMLRAAFIKTVKKELEGRT